MKRNAMKPSLSGIVLALALLVSSTSCFASKSFMVPSGKQKLHWNATVQKKHVLTSTPKSLSTEDHDGAPPPSPDTIVHCRGGGLVTRSYSAYIKQIRERPLRTQSLTAAFISLVGDVLSQILESKMGVGGAPFALNFTRLGAFTVAGAIFTGVFVHVFYERLWEMGRWQERRGIPKVLQILSQNIVDQTIGVALFFPAYFYVYEYAEALVGLRAPSIAAATAKMQSEMISVLVAQYRVWPLANLINFWLIPEHLRVAVSNIIAVFWNAYLCAKVA